jgi:ABC-type Fe3+-siderophore transport system permease subunit
VNQIDLHITAVPPAGPAPPQGRAAERATILRLGLVAVALPLVFVAHLQFGSPLAWGEQWALLLGRVPESFAEIQFYFAALPRAVIAILVGGAFGVAGSVLQQATRNRLVSPLTLGASSGAWLALVAGAVWFPMAAQDHGVWLAMGGAAAAASLAALIAGRSGLSGLPVVLAGMAVHILLGAVATGITLFNEQYTANLFIWGAGDLTQTDWSWTLWLLPRLSVIAVILAIAPRPLTLLRLGESGARARGLAVGPAMLLLVLSCLWLTAVTVTAVGIIGFVALLAPNIARRLGARRSLEEILLSLLLGALLLLVTDGVALLASTWSTNLVPSGAAASLIGAPALILLARRRLQAEDYAAFTMMVARQRIGRGGLLRLAAVAFLIVFAASTVAPSAAGWTIALPDPLVWSLRFPRILAAAAAGIGTAVAGLILQRLIRNPLASPDIMGMTQGATLALAGTAVFIGGTIHEVGIGVALAGSIGVLALLVVLGRRNNFAPGTMVLIGISLAALVDGLVQFVLASGDEGAYAILNWLGGSTYRVSGGEAILLFCGVLALALLCFALRRWLTLVSIGDDIAAARGLAVGRARLVLLLIASAQTALVVAVMGPVAFVGLLAPHMAALAGAGSVRAQLLAAPLLGLGLMVLSDWLGRSLLYPMQLPAGTVASIIGGSYFVYLLGRRGSASA